MDLLTSLRALSINADLSLETPHGTVSVRDQSGEQIDVVFPTKKAFRHVLRGVRTSFSLVNQQDSLQKWVDQSQIVLRVDVEEKMMVRFAPEAPPFLNHFPLAGQYILTLLNQ